MLILLSNNALLPILVFNNTVLPSIEDTIIIKEWFCLGPFSIGVREGIIGLNENIEDEDFKPEENLFYPSILVQGGKVSWQKVISKNDVVEIKYQNVLWDTIQDIYGAAGILCAGYAYGEFECAGEKRALVNAKEVSSFILNGKSFPGDVYGDGYVLIPVVLKNGKNKVLLKCSGYGDTEFSFKISPIFQPLMIITKDVLLPDFIKGEIAETNIGMPVLNTTEKRLTNGLIEVTGDGLQKTQNTIASLMPLSAIKVPVQIKSAKLIEASDSLLIMVSVKFEDFTTKENFWIKIKNKGENFIKTFISKIDNSCQYYAVLPPENYSSASTYALIISLHGAGVEARGQVTSYRQKDWAFVIAPTNRRRFGFDWQDWGRLDFLEVLEDVKKNFKIDENRIYLTGHSMGGHGVWHIGLTHPDIFAAIAPSAGWTCFQLYLPFFLQKSYLFAHPEQVKYRDMVLREDLTTLFLENALNLPIYILHGGSDDNVPPIQARLMNRYLSKWHKNYIYNEVPDKGHWWDIDTVPGVDCVDLKEMMDFLKDEKREPYPKKVVFKTSDIAHSNQAYWVRIDELEKIYQEGKIEAEIDSNVIKIRLSNLKGFTLFLSNHTVSPGTVKFIINGQQLNTEYREKCGISFYRNGDKFKIGKPKEKEFVKKQNLYGPIKRAYFEPFILVYGTIGDSLSTAFNLHQARLQSYQWWIRANGYAIVIPDTEVTDEIIKNYNLILFGNSETNSIIKNINKKLPIYFNNYRSVGELIKYIQKDEVYISIGNEIIKEKDLCLLEIYPNPLNQNNLVLLYSSTTKEAGKYIGLFSTLYSGAGLPDFIIWDKSAAQFGWAGVIAAGFFDKNWRLSKDLIYIKK